MELDQFILNFSEQFDDLDVAKISRSTVFKEMEEWSSLVALSVIAMIDEEYDVNVGAKEIVGATTVEDLFNKVKSLR